MKRTRPKKFLKPVLWSGLTHNKHRYSIAVLRDKNGSWQIHAKKKDAEQSAHIAFSNEAMSAVLSCILSLRSLDDGALPPSEARKYVETKNK